MHILCLLEFSFIYLVFPLCILALGHIMQSLYRRPFKKSHCLPFSSVCQILQLLGFAQGRIVMALEGGYNLRSIANSVCACAKVLLGDKFTFNAPEMQPFESTWRVIQAVTVCMHYCCLVLYFLRISIAALSFEFHIG